MADYYCNKCAKSNNKITIGDVTLMDLTGSNYTKNKFNKHTSKPTTVPSGSIISIFTNASYDEVESVIKKAQESGSVQEHSNGTRNIIYVSNCKIGDSYDASQNVNPNDAALVIFQDEPSKLHSYPISSSYLDNVSCCICGSRLY